jgi:hypothetical protein
VQGIDRLHQARAVRTPGRNAAPLVWGAGEVANGAANDRVRIARKALRQLGGVDRVAALESRVVRQYRTEGHWTGPAACITNHSPQRGALPLVRRRPLGLDVAAVHPAFVVVGAPNAHPRLPLLDDR